MATKFEVSHTPLVDTLVVGAMLSAVVAKPEVLVQLAAQPEETVAQSERNSKSKEPLLEVTLPGDDVPVYCPISGAAVVAPSYINK